MWHLSEVQHFWAWIVRTRAPDAIKALEMALKRRCPDAGLLHHSDQGSTYASEDYQRVLEVHGITCSMSRTGWKMISAM